MNFEQVVRTAKRTCFSSGPRIADHFVDITEMVPCRSELGSKTGNVKCAGMPPPGIPWQVCLLISLLAFALASSPNPDYNTLLFPRLSVTALEAER